MNSGGDPVLYMTLADAQTLQSLLAPPAARIQQACGATGKSRDTVAAVVARVEPNADVDAVAGTVRQWKYLSANDPGRAAGSAGPLRRRPCASSDRPLSRHPAHRLGRRHCFDHLHHDHGKS
ncbi:hypothetical protein [Rhizobium terricola]|uniref:hypothetical protein n=1 Tax=Rhizobium terricola TaxID=2728849 RepID=UPI00197FA920|nr:hypothetical protein [Rhizobium terricola]